MISAIANLSSQNKAIIIGSSSIALITGLFLLLAADQILPTGINAISESEGAKALGCIFFVWGFIGLIFSGKILKESFQKVKQQKDASLNNSLSSSPAKITSTTAPASSQKKSQSVSSTLRTHGRPMDIASRGTAISSTASRSTAPIERGKKEKEACVYDVWTDEEISDYINRLNENWRHDKATYKTKDMYSFILHKEGGSLSHFGVGRILGSQISEIPPDHPKICDLCGPCLAGFILEIFPEERCRLHFIPDKGLFVVMDFQEGEKIITDWFSASKEQQFLLIKAAFKALNKLKPFIESREVTPYLDVTCGYSNPCTSSQPKPHLHISIEPLRLAGGRRMDVLKFFPDFNRLTDLASKY